KQRIDEQGFFLVNQLQAKLLSYEEIVASLNNFVRVSPNLNFSDFKSFTRQSLATHPDLQSLSWNLLITDDARKPFEAAMTGEPGASGFQITQLGRQGQLVAADVRDRYIVVRYIGSLNKHNEVPGYDIASDPIRLAAINTAMQSGKATITAPVRLLQESGSSLGILLLDPVYPDQPAEAQPIAVDKRKPLGFTVGVFLVEEMLSNHLIKNLSDTFTYVLEDKDAPEGSKLLYRSAQAIPPQFIRFAWESDIPVGGRLWHLSVYPTPAYFEGQRSTLAWAAQATGLVLASLFQFFLLTMTGRTAAVQRQVNEQTKKLSDKEKFLRLSQQGGEIGTWEADLLNNKQIWSESCIALLGFPVPSVPRWEDFLAMVHPEDRQRVIDATQAHFDKGIKYDVEYRTIEINGRIRWMRSAGQVERDAEGQPIIMRGIVQDISLLKQAEAALRISEARFRAIIEASPVPYALNDDSQNISYLNAAFIRTFGYTLEDIPTLADWWPKAYPDPDYCQWVAAAWKTHLDKIKRQGTDFEPIELNIHCKDGRVKTALVGASRLGGDFSGIHLVILYDITERKAMQKQIDEQLAFTEAVIDAEVDALAVCHGIDESPYVRFTVWNSSMETLTGYGMDEINRLGWYQTVYIDPLVQEKARQRMERMRQGEHLRNEEWTITCKNGERRVVLIHTVTVAEDDRGLHVLAVMHDITERKLVENDLRIAATVFESQEGMLVTDVDNIILRVNRAFTNITGYTAEEVVGKNPRILQSGRQDTAFYAAMWDSINNTGSWEGEVWNRRKNGEIFPERLTITAVKGQDGIVTNYVATLFDITLSKAAADEIELLAFYDPLTGLPNRRLLLDRLKPALASSQRSGRKGALLFIDMDNFKNLNDTLGHDLGDILLQQVAERLIACVREVDTVARLGGDEFVVMLEDLSEQTTVALEQTKVVGNKVLVALNQPYQLATHDYHSTPSIGVTLFSGSEQAIDELLKQADIAMYQAKMAGRNTLRFFDLEMQASITA
ncbi:MAG: PAS domain S-box protein, partial [Gammaproteobacteria bacterium]